jgi:hypothetical protein
MIDPTALENAIYEWITDTVGGTVILADQSAPRPVEPYTMFNISSILPVGFPGKLLTDFPDDQVQIDYSETYNLSISINFYRTGALGKASALRDSLNEVLVVESLVKKGLFPISTSDIRHIPEVVKKIMEERFQMDVSLYIRSSMSEIIEQIKKIEITNGLDETTVII